MEIRRLLLTGKDDRELAVTLHLGYLFRIPDIAKGVFKEKADGGSVTVDGGSFAVSGIQQVENKPADIGISNRHGVFSGKIQEAHYITVIRNCK